MLDALLNLDSRWKSDKVCKARKDACNNYSHNNNTINQDETEILGFFEDIGIFLKRGAFDSELIWDKFSYYIDHYWYMFKSHVLEFRRIEKDNTWYEKFEYLKKEMDIVSTKKKVKIDPKSDDEIAKFIIGEI